MLKKNNKLILIIKKNYQLKLLKTKDIKKEYINWMNKYEITKFTEQKFKKQTYSEIYKFVEKKYKSKNDFLFGIFFKKEHIGNIKLGPINWNHKSAEVSYIIGKENFWGKGLATGAVQKVVRFATKNLKLNKINAGYYENNIGSKKVLKKCGFVVEGKKKSEIIFNERRISLILVGYKL